MIWGYGSLFYEWGSTYYFIDGVWRLILNSLTNPYFILVEKSGKTLHLLKSGSKPIKPRSKRKKIEVLGTLGQFHDSKKKPVLAAQQQ